MTSTISDAQVEAALKAWFSGDQSETDQALENSMRAALAAAAQARKPTTVDALTEAIRRTRTRLEAYCNDANAGRMPSDAREFMRRVQCGFDSLFEDAEMIVVHEGERVEPPMPAAGLNASLSADESLRRHGGPSPATRKEVMPSDDGGDPHRCASQGSASVPQEISDKTSSVAPPGSAPDTLGRADDWQLVPKVPTEAMLSGARDWAVAKYGIGVGNDAAIGCYQAMLSAAPSHPQPEQHDGADVQGEPSAADGEFNVLQNAYNVASVAVERQRTEISALTKALAEAKKVIAPFAEYAHPKGKVPGELIITNGSLLAKSQLRMRHCYAARAFAEQQGWGVK